VPRVHSDPTRKCPENVAEEGKDIEFEAETNLRIQEFADEGKNVP
jgi:hypothetical protein